MVAFRLEAPLGASRQEVLVVTLPGLPKEGPTVVAYLETCRRCLCHTSCRYIRGYTRTSHQYTDHVHYIEARSFLDTGTTTTHRLKLLSAGLGWALIQSELNVTSP